MPKNKSPHKKNEHPENEIREGQENSSIRPKKEELARKSYPQLNKEDAQHKVQPEFIDNSPNREDEELSNKQDAD